VAAYPDPVFASYRARHRISRTAAVKLLGQLLSQELGQDLGSRKQIAVLAVHATRMIVNQAISTPGANAGPKKLVAFQISRAESEA
jgi:hypothetical protein